MRRLLLSLLAASAARAQTTEFGPPIVLTESFHVPAGLGLDAANGRILVADSGNHRIKYAAISSLAGTQVASHGINVNTVNGAPEIIVGATYAASSPTGWSVRYDNVTFTVQ